MILLFDKIFNSIPKVFFLTKVNDLKQIVPLPLSCKQFKNSLLLAKTLAVKSNNTTNG